MKKFLNLKGVTILKKNEKQSVQGGRMVCTNEQGICIKYSKYCSELKCTFDPEAC